MHWRMGSFFLDQCEFCFLDFLSRELAQGCEDSGGGVDCVNLRLCFIRGRKEISEAGRLCFGKELGHLEGS